MDKREPTFISYSTYINHRVGKTGRRLAKLVRNNFISYEKIFNNFGDGQLEVQAVTIVSDSDKIDVLDISNPSCSRAIQEFEYHFKK